MVFPFLNCGNRSSQFLEFRFRVIGHVDDLCQNQREVCSTLYTIQKRKQFQRMIRSSVRKIFVTNWMRKILRRERVGSFSRTVLVEKEISSDVDPKKSSICDYDFSEKLIHLLLIGVKNNEKMMDRFNSGEVKKIFKYFLYCHH